ncbi:MAG: hypothetical protein ACE37F_16410 [Nannocystaceae bacterium]|nr:hypothetical protein [bacterium]
MSQDRNKRVSIAIESDDGAALCGFHTNAPLAHATSLFARSIARLRRRGTARVTSIVVSVEGRSEQFLSFQQAERGLARMHRDTPFRPTAKPPQPNSTR